MGEVRGEDVERGIAVWGNAGGGVAVCGETWGCGRGEGRRGKYRGG